MKSPSSKTCKNYLNKTIIIHLYNIKIVSCSYQRLQLTNTSIDLQNKLRNVFAESKKPPPENLKTEIKTSESSSNTKESATNKNLVSLTPKLNTPVESKQITKNELTKVYL